MMVYGGSRTPWGADLRNRPNKAKLLGGVTLTSQIVVGPGGSTAMGSGVLAHSDWLGALSKGRAAELPWWG